MRVYKREGTMIERKTGTLTRRAKMKVIGIEMAITYIVVGPRVEDDGARHTVVTGVGLRSLNSVLIRIPYRD